MPHPILAASTHLCQLARGAIPTRWSPPLASVARWSAERATAWQRATGWLVGCNFTPSTAGNQLEMWQADTFDPETIDRELGWARALGFNSIRVFLHDLVWRIDGEAFLDRIDAFLTIADRHGISTMLVLFDGVWNPHPRRGPQPDPRPGLHNSIWVQSPGAEILGDPARWASLRPYVDGLLARFGRDPRVAAWDLFNEPDQPNAISYCRRDVAGKSRQSIVRLSRPARSVALLTKERPDQPPCPRRRSSTTRCGPNHKMGSDSTSARPTTIILSLSDVSARSSSGLT